LARDPFQLVQHHGLTWLESAAFARFPWLIHGFCTRQVLSTRKGRSTRPRADFNLGLTADAQPRQVEANRQRFYRALGSDLIAASLRQIHSATVYEVVRPAPRARGTHSTREVLEYRPAGWRLPDWAQNRRNPSVAGARLEARSRPPQPENGRLAAGDALVASARGVLLTVRTADCLPVLLVDTRLRVVAAIHAGWRGALGRIIEKTVSDLRRLFNSHPEQLEAALGPAIGRCCYEVGEEVVDAFEGRFVESSRFFHKPVPGAEPIRSDLRYAVLFEIQTPLGHGRPSSKTRRLHLDLAAVARDQLRRAGLDDAAIHNSGYCTACRPDLFFSHRREGAQAGRMMAAIAVRASSTELRAPGPQNDN